MNIPASPPPTPVRHSMALRPPRRTASPLRTCLTCGAGVIVLIVAVSCLCCVGSFGFYFANPPEQTNILILGGDARPGTKEERIARTDSIIIMSIDPDGNQVSMLSVPRGMYVESPTYGLIMANTVVRNAEVFEPGTGEDEMVVTMEDTFDIKLDHTVRISFEGFVELVDAVGGIEIDVPKRIVDHQYPTHDGGTIDITFEPGKQTMDGERALQYARTRHQDDDYGRAARQQQVIEALMKKLANPLHWSEAWQVIDKNYETDLTAEEAFRLAPALVLYGRGDSLQQLVINTDYMTVIDGNLRPNMDKLDAWIDEHLR
ncbi:MAG: LCP family protein [Chloroflexi bacterium]|nr:LCP family protein [Chloroflexota bacterium]